MPKTFKVSLTAEESARTDPLQVMRISPVGDVLGRGEAVSRSSTGRQENEADFCGFGNTCIAFGTGLRVTDLEAISEVEHLQTPFNPIFLK